MRPPAFQFYVDDFLGGTFQFSDAELGLYIRLLCVQWSTGSIPDNDEELSSYGKGTTPIHRVKTKFDKCADGHLRNERMELERQKQIEYRESRSANGKQGGRPCKASGKHMVSKTKAQESSPASTLQSPSPVSDLLLTTPDPISLTVASASAEEIYKAYPKRVAKPDALKAITKAFKEIEPNDLLAKVQHLASLWKGEDMQFLANPATWFNQQRFNDDPTSWAPKQPTQPKPRPLPEQHQMQEHIEIKILKP